MNRNIGQILLAIWLILTAVSLLGALSIGSAPMAILALVAGAFILAGR